MKSGSILLAAIAAATIHTASAQDLDSLLKSMGVDQSTISNAGKLMGGEVNQEAAYYYKEGTDAGMSGNLDKAQAHLEKATALAPRFAGAHFNLACVYSKKGNASAAIRSLEQAIALDSSYKSKAKRDSDFTSLRGNRRYLELVQ